MIADILVSSSTVFKMQQIFNAATYYLVLLLMVHQIDFSFNRRPRIFTPLQVRGREVRIMVNEFAEVVRPVFGMEFRAEVVKNNKSIPVLNIDFTVLDEKALSYKLWIDIYEKAGTDHTFRRSPLTVHCSPCDVLNGDYFSTMRIATTNLPYRCPFKVGKLYYVRDFYGDEKTTPPTISASKWRFNVQVGPEGKKDTNKTLLMIYHFRIEQKAVRNQD